MKEIQLPSGASLSIGEVPFTEAKALYQALLREGKLIEYKGSQELPELFKQILCVGFSSVAIEQSLWGCLPRCLYNGLKIDTRTFEPVAAREDYLSICVEVMSEVCGPFGKSLLCRVKTPIVDGRKFPDIQTVEDDLIIFFRLCKAGFARSVSEARQMGTREVLQALAYESFCNDYEMAYLELNK